MSPIAPTLQAFFTDRLTKQRQVSPRTIASYRDSLRLLIGFAHECTGTAPSRLEWTDLDADLTAAFLDHLEHARRNSARTRNRDCGFIGVSGLDTLSVARRGRCRDDDTG